MEMLSKAPSNLKEFNNAADIYNKYVIPTRLDLDRVGMHYAVSAIFEENPDDLSVFNFSALIKSADPYEIESPFFSTDTL